jgi:aryl-alcohol dehydrogenase-like predicted oxidoreductase
METNKEWNFPQIGLGCMSLPVEYSAAKVIIDAAIDLGIGFMDTADLYQYGHNEENIGKALIGKRSRILLASKVGNQWNPSGTSWTWNPSKSYILKAIDETLKRLKTDYLDLYQLHGGTVDDPWEETLEAFQLLLDQGKIRAFGISSIRPNVIRKVCSMQPPKAFMIQYSPLDRRAEEEIFPLLQQTKTKVLARGCFAKGLLINKPEEDFLGIPREQVKKIRERILDSGYSSESLLIRYGLYQKAVGSLIIGASSLEQVDRMISGYGESHQISEELIQELMMEFPANTYQEHR